MAAVYAALVSLMNVLNRIQLPCCPTSFDKSQIQSLFNKVNPLVEFLEAYSERISESDLTQKMVDAAFAAEDAIESYIIGRALNTINNDEGLMCQILEKANHEMDLILRDFMEFNEKYGNDHQLPKSVVSVGLSVPSSETITTEGFQEEIKHLMAQLITRQSSRQIIPVVGMGGIGKTTLATSVYNHKNLRYHFDVTAWVTVSQVFTAATIIRPLLSSIGEEDYVGDAQLGEKLHKCLFSRRYLIVLDDIWDIKAWDAVSRFLPDNNNGSRILLTTRLSSLAHSVGSCNPYEIKLLDGDNSWDFLSKKVFEQKVFPPELEKCGRRIARGCKGLPLALVVVGGLLKMSANTSEYWEDVAKSISSIISREDNDHCLNVLSLSYRELPIHLKPCFLYLATYPEDYEIRASKVIKLWAADGFLKPNVDKTMEEVALECLNDLISRNLIIVKERDSMGDIKCLTFHDLVRDLCIREARRERFLCELDGVDDFPEAVRNQRRLVARGDGQKYYADHKTRKGLARSLIWLNIRTAPSGIWLGMLRTYCSINKPFQNPSLYGLVNLRLIYFTLFTASSGSIYLSHISQMWNLETLSINSTYQESLPCEIWELRHTIKHIIFRSGVILPPPPTARFDVVFEKLQTLKKIRLEGDGVHEVLNRIPNVKRLGIFYVQGEVGKQAEVSVDLIHLQNLERLHVRMDSPNVQPKTIKFPDSLIKLSLFYVHLSWKHMTAVGSLPNLQVFKIWVHECADTEWNTNEGEFQSLKYLSLRHCNLVAWKTEDSSHFPSLERLILNNMELEEIPEVFGESMTLQYIELKECTMSAVTSAKNIQEEQQRLSNYNLIVEVVPSWEMKRDRKTDLESLVTEHFHVKLG